METSSYWLVFLAAAFAINISPGPDILYVLSKTIAQGRKIGFASSLGVCSGAMVHVLAAALGLSAILATSALAYRPSSPPLPWLSTSLSILAQPICFTWVFNLCCPKVYRSTCLQKTALQHQHGRHSSREYLSTCSTPKRPCFLWLFCRSLYARN